MAESRLQRWSRQKAEARKVAEPAPPSPAESAPTPEAQELALNETLPEHEVLAKYHLPDPDALTLGTDITGFLRKEIPELLRRKALRSLWKSNPVLAVLDGLNDYDEDFTGAATAGTTVKTLYQVGQGLIDKTPKADKPGDTNTVQSVVEPSRDHTAEPPEPQVTTARIESGEPSAPQTVAKPDVTPEQPEMASAEPETEPAPRYRPRMQFDH